MCVCVGVASMSLSTDNLSMFSQNSVTLTFLHSSVLSSMVNNINIT